MEEAKTDKNLYDRVKKWVVENLPKVGVIGNKEAIFCPPQPMDGKSWSSGVGTMLLPLERFAELYAEVFRAKENPTVYDLFMYIENKRITEHREEVTDIKAERAIQIEKNLLMYFGYRG